MSKSEISIRTCRVWLLMARQAYGTHVDIRCYLNAACLAYQTYVRYKKLETEQTKEIKWRNVA